MPAAVILHSTAIKPRFQKINVENMPSKHIYSEIYILILIKEETAKRGGSWPKNVDQLNRVIKIHHSWKKKFPDLTFEADTFNIHFLI